MKNFHTPFHAKTNPILSHLVSDSVRAFLVVGLLVALLTTGSLFIAYGNLLRDAGQWQEEVRSLELQLKEAKELSSTRQIEIDQLKSEDQRKRNDDLEKLMADIQKAYDEVVAQYERMVDIREGRGKGSVLDKTFASVMSNLADQRYAEATTDLTALRVAIASESARLAAASAPTAVTAPVSNTPPNSGYSRQSVQIDGGTFVVDIIAADLNSTRVIVDTASDATCGNACPVLPLATYVSRSGAFAGINGTYFCPESYPSCAGKTNSFDLLVMNKNKTYFNSDNNVYSQNPVAIFSAGSARFLSKAQDWGRDTGVDAVISNFPLLLINGQVQFGGNDDAKMSSRGSRSFIGSKGNTVYIGVARNVTVAENARVLKALGLDHAMNLDSGGSTALWSGGYKAGPGRSIPNAVLFVRR